MDGIREIREIMNDINSIINESYVFNSKQEEIRPQKQESSIEPNQVSPSVPEVNKTNIESGSVDTEINKMRKISIQLLSNLDPSEDTETYKLVKGIWDSCDKYLTKDNIQKPKNNNNNNI